MKLRPTLVVAPLLLLLLLLTWLLVRGINPGAELFDRALATLDTFVMTDSALGRDVLAARAGLLHNYDPVVRELAGLNANLVALREAAAVDADMAVALDRLAATVGEQEQLIELFKSNNALLQNSLAYFGRFSSRLGAAERTAALSAAVSGLSAAVLHLSLDTSPQIVREVQERLDALTELAASFDGPDAEAVRGLLVHGQVLHDLLPATDGLLKAIFDLPTVRDQAAFRAIVLQRQIASRSEAREYRFVLYGVSLLLLILLIHLGLQLRARALALQDRAAFEHFVAGISTRFISARPQQVDGQVRQALAELAQRVGADRAYFVWGGLPTERHLWSRGGISYPLGWPDHALDLAARFDASEDGVVHIRHVSHLPPGPSKDALAAADLSAWACISRRHGPDVIGVLGFDVVRPFVSMRGNEFGLLRMALDALANAVGRDLMEQERTRLETRLQQARHMETVGALASGIAHNFNNIVGAILGYTEMAEAQVAADSRPARNLKEIRRAGERARDLIEQILAFGRRRDPRRVRIGVGEMLTEAESLLRASLPPGIELVVGDVPETAVVLGEPAQLQQVILNLCNNAGQAMDGVGTIEVQTGICDIPADQAQPYRELLPGRYAVVTVVDHGRGMDSTTLDRIFEPFFTTRLAGNGLGLATVQEIVREHEGTVIVQSQLGVGSRFEVWLPCVSAAEFDHAAGPGPIPRGIGQTVLLISDNRDRLMRDEEMVAALGYEPVGFAEPAGMLAACQAAPDRFDAVLVNARETAEATLGLAAELHRAAPALPILLATPSVDEFSAQQLIGAGISEVVRQPLLSHEIAMALARRLAPADGRRVPAV
jgi:signal transduction histidine kinase